jgi:hypothetical protein
MDIDSGGVGVNIAGGEPGVIGTPVQWASAKPLRRPPECVAVSIVGKGEWPDPDPDPVAEAAALAEYRRRQQHITAIVDW